MKRLRLLVVLAALIVACPPAEAQSGRSLDGQIDNFAFLHYYGTGVYRVGEQTVWVLKVPPTLTLKPMRDGRTGILLRSAVVLAIEEFFDFIELDFTKNGLYSVSVGGELLIPVGRLKTLRPWLDVGFGADNVEGRESLILGTGLTTELIFPWKQWLLAAQPGVGFALSRRLPDLEVGGDYSEIHLALTARHPLPFNVASGQPDAGLYGRGSYLFDSMVFIGSDGDVSPIRGLYEVGFVMGFRQPRPLLGFFRAPSLRVGLEFGEQFRGFKIGLGGDWVTDTTRENRY